MVRLGDRTSIRSSRCSRPLWMVVPSPLTLVAVQIVAVALGALPVFWLGRRHLGSERDGGAARARVPRVPVDRWTRGRRVPPGDARDPALLFCVWFLDYGPARAVRGLRGARAGDGRAHGARDRGARRLVRALAAKVAGRRRRRRHRARLARRGRGRRRPPRSCRSGVRRRGRAASTERGRRRHRVAWVRRRGLRAAGFTDRVGGPLRGHARRATSYTSRCSAAPLLAEHSRSARRACGRRPCRSCFAVNLLAGFPATTDPRAHYIAGIVPFLVRGDRARDSGGSPRCGRRRGVSLVLTLCVAFAVVLGPWPGTPGRSITSYWARCAGGAGQRASSRSRARARRRAGQRDEQARLAPRGAAVPLQRAGRRTR